MDWGGVGWPGDELGSLGRRRRGLGRRSGLERRGEL